MAKNWKDWWSAELASLWLWTKIFGLLYLFMVLICVFFGLIMGNRVDLAAALVLILLGFFYLAIFAR